MGLKNGGKNGGGKRSPQQAPIQAHAPDRGRSAYIPGLGVHYGGSGLLQKNIAQTTGAKTFRPSRKRGL
jgi:hypothetical protein